MSKDKTKKKDKKTFSFYAKILLLVLVIALIIHIIFSVVLSLNPDSFRAVKTVYDIINTGISTLYMAVIASGVVIAGFLFGDKKGKLPPILKWIKNFLTAICVIGVFLLPVLFVNATWGPMIDNFEEEYKEQQKEDEQTPLSKEHDLTIIIDFNDILFENYDVSFFNDNKYPISEEIVKKLKESINEFNENCSKDNFEYYTQSAEDYEAVYNFIDTNNLFENDMSKKTDILNICILDRKSADENFKMSENQRQIALRYKEWGDECHRYNYNNDAIIKYQEALLWDLKALQTYYNEDNSDNKIVGKILKNINDSLTEMSVTVEINSEKHQRILIVSEIFEYVEIQIK